MQTPISYLSQCVSRTDSVYSRGQTKTFYVNLKAGDSYRVSAQGCDATKSISVTITLDGKTIKSGYGKPVNLCFVAPKTDQYKYEVKMAGLYSGNSAGKIDHCLYESYSCNQ